MFIDLSNLVSMQGEMVDRIEDHINSEYLLTTYVKFFMFQVPSGLINDVGYQFVPIHYTRLVLQISWGKGQGVPVRTYQMPFF
jgi:hypothetical protein